MPFERWFNVALKQAAIIEVVLLAVPTVGALATLLLAILSALFCEQLHGLMTLSVIATAIVITPRESRQSSHK